MGLYIWIFLAWGYLGVKGDKTLQLNPDETVYKKFVHDSLYVNCFLKNAVGITWFKVSPKHTLEEIPKGQRDRVHVEPSLDDSRGLSLVFTSMETSDTGNYTCRATYNNEEVRTSFRLTVFIPISFADTPQIQNATEGETASIRCEARGDPEPTVTWHVSGRNITSDQYAAKYKKLGDGLSINEVTRKDGLLTYKCRAMQVHRDISELKDIDIKLNVLYKPQWNYPNKTTDVYTYLGGTSNITCVVEANPPAEFSWYAGNKQIVEAIDVKIFHENNTSVLMISKFNPKVIGDYKCRAKNPLGVVERIFHLEEGPKPAPPHKVKLHSAKHDSLKLDIHSIDKDGFETTAYRVQILEKKESDKGRGWEVAKEVVIPKGKTNTYTIDKLTPNTEYLIRVHSINAAGPSDYTNQLNAQTSSSSAKLIISNALIFLLLFVCRYT